MWISKFKKYRVSDFTETFLIFFDDFGLFENHKILENSNFIFMHNMGESIISTCKFYFAKTPNLCSNLLKFFPKKTDSVRAGARQNHFKMKMYQFFCLNFPLKFPNVLFSFHWNKKSKKFAQKARIFEKKNKIPGPVK